MPPFLFGFGYSWPEEHLFAPNAYSWKALQFASWVEDDQEVVKWARSHGTPTAVDGSSVEISRVVRKMIELEKQP